MDMSVKCDRRHKEQGEMAYGAVLRQNWDLPGPRMYRGLQATDHFAMKTPMGTL